MIPATRRSSSSPPRRETCPKEGALQRDGVGQGRQDEIRMEATHADRYGNTRIEDNLILP